MGISVPRAYRLKKAKDFWKLTKDIKQIGALRVTARLEEFFLQLMDTVDVESEEYKKRREAGESEGSARASLVDKLMRERYRESTITRMRDPFDFDVSVAFRQYGKSVYLIPQCDMMLHQVLDFLDEDPRLEEFWYDNRGDKPDEIPSAVWRRRGKVWDKLTESANWDPYVYIELCSWNMWWQVNPHYSLMRSGKLRDWGKKTPSMAQLVKDAAAESKGD